MGLFSFLFKKKNDDNEEIFDYYNNRLSIDLNNQGININGKTVSLPATFEDFSFLGTPRKIKTEAGVNYAWDDAGVYCYTRGEEKTVVCFGIAMKKGEMDLKTNPKSLYDGELTINGREWQSEISKGENTEVFTRIICGEYCVVAEYCEFMDSSAYSVVEIQRADRADGLEFLNN